MAFAYFIILGLDILDRRAWERQLLEGYLAELAAAGAPAPDFETAWHAYRESAIFPYQVWFTNRPIWQPEPLIAACASRAAWAAWDLDIYALGGT